MSRLVKFRSMNRGTKLFSSNFLHLIGVQPRFLSSQDSGLLTGRQEDRSLSTNDVQNPSKSKNTVNRDCESLKKLERMRSEMRRLHGLELEDLANNGGGSEPSTITSDSSHKPVFPSDKSENETVNEFDLNDQDLTKRQSKFLKRIQNGRAKKKNVDKYIYAPFGLVRVDSMNLPQKEFSDDLLNFKDRNATELNLRDDRSVESLNSQNRVSAGLSQLNFPSEMELSSELNSSEFKSSEVESRQSEHLSEHRLNEDLKDSYEQSYSVAGPTSKRQMLGKSQNQTMGKNATLRERSNVFDQQYFGNCFDADAKSEINAEYKNSKITPECDNIFEEQYFGAPEANNLELSEFSNELVKSNLPLGIRNNSPELFASDQKPAHIEQTSNLFEAQFFETSEQSVKLQSTDSNQVNDLKQAFTSPLLSQEISNNDNTIIHEGVTRREMKQKTAVIADTENPKTAYDMAMKIRLQKKGKLNDADESVGHPNATKWSGRVDSKGFRLLSDQTVDVQYMTDDALLNVLRDSVLYEDDNVIAINKPYGLPSHGGPGVHQSVGKFLDPLAAKLDRTGRLGTLHLVHRLDKETTGVMVLARSQQTAEMLFAMFKKRMIVKRYWAITKGIPNPVEGVIEIPMAESKVQGKYRMELRPIYSNDDRRMLMPGHARGDRLEAITNYKVLSSANSAALVECEPETGVKHQIRCHLAFGLNTPILGDHKFSHYSKLAPQKLYPEILQRLGIRQSKARHLPMHLHAKVLILPEFRDGRNLFISANLPKHFLQNMRWLKLQPPK